MSTKIIEPSSPARSFTMPTDILIPVFLARLITVDRELLTVERRWCEAFLAAPRHKLGETCYVYSEDFQPFWKDWSENKTEWMERLAQSTNSDGKCCPVSWMRTVAYAILESEAAFLGRKTGDGESNMGDSDLDLDPKEV